MRERENSRSSRGDGVVRVEIYDQSYTLAGESDDAYVSQLAEKVDTTMRRIARQTRVVDSLRVAVLAAVNLADENEALRLRVAKLERLLSEKAADYGEKLDRLLRAV